MSTVPPMPVMDPVDYLQVCQFLYHEADMLDRKAWKAWGELFAPDGIYWVPSSQGQADPFEHVSLIYDTPLLRQIRLARLHNGEAASFQAGFETSHHVSNISAQSHDGEGGLLQVESRLIVGQYSPAKSVTFHARCRHDLRRDAATGHLSIVLKRVDLIDAQGSLGDILVPL